LLDDSIAAAEIEGGDDTTATQTDSTDQTVSDATQEGDPQPTAEKAADDS
jgi:hypothetical protein